MGPQQAWQGVGAPLGPRVAFLATLTLAPLYALIDVAQRLTPGPNTAISRFFALPAALHVLAFVGLYALTCLIWYSVLRLAEVDRRADHPLARLSEVGAIRPLLRVYLALVPLVLLLVILAHALSVGLLVQALLVAFTCVYAQRGARAA